MLIHTDPANDLDKQVGDTVNVLWQSGGVGTLTIAGVYGNATFGNWLISLDTLDAVSDAPARDLFIIAKLADGATAAEGDAAVANATAEFPQADVQTNAEFRKSQEDQINQLLLTITILLLMSIIIAVLGIAITLALGVFERTREIGLLRAVGMNRRQLRRSVRWEAVIVSSFGAVVGIVLGTFLGVIASLAVPNDVISKLAFNPAIIVVVMVFAVLAGLAASLYPSFKGKQYGCARSNRDRISRQTHSMALDIDQLDDSVMEFLTERHLATLTTLRTDGSPHVVAVGFSYDPVAQVARVITWATSQKAINVGRMEARGQHAAVCQVDGGPLADP